MYTLLTKGFGFERWDNIRFLSEVKGQTVGWALGYMLEETNNYPSIFDTKDVSSREVFCFTAIGIGTLLIILVTFVWPSYNWYFATKRNLANKYNVLEEESNPFLEK